MSILIILVGAQFLNRELTSGQSANLRSLRRARMLVLKTLVFTMLAPGTVAVLIPSWILSGEPSPRFDVSGPMRLAGWALIALGAALYLRCAWEFITAGQGTPAPYDPPKELVVT